MDLKRRGFLAAGASVVAIASLPSGGAAQQAEEAGQRYRIGGFILTRTAGARRDDNGKRAACRSSIETTSRSTSKMSPAPGVRSF
ncbi:MAG: hypothetical protein ABSF49_19480 [Roseiarcus sp.]|jgi:hypothetical protein|uniref:hypothetical protein n=1 Tax=Roseiarcus sp. TaxID=1969460 RepID=UPI003C208970